MQAKSASRYVKVREKSSDGKVFGYDYEPVIGSHQLSQHGRNASVTQVLQNLPDQYYIPCRKGI
jgi:hypothetical protein